MNSGNLVKAIPAETTPCQSQKMRDIVNSKEIRDSIPRDVPDVTTPTNLQTVDESSRPNSKGG